MIVVTSRRGTLLSRWVEIVLLGVLPVCPRGVTLFEAVLGVAANCFGLGSALHLLTASDSLNIEFFSNPAKYADGGSFPAV